MKEMITVEKEVYEAVLRNSVRVNDLEAENQQLKELLDSSLETNKALAHRLNMCKELIISAKDIIEWYKADCGYKDTPTEAILTKITNVIGEKK